MARQAEKNPASQPATGSLKVLKCTPATYRRVRAMAAKHRLTITRTVELLADAWDGIDAEHQYAVLTRDRAAKPRKRARAEVVVGVGVNGVSGGDVCANGQAGGAHA